MIEHGTSDGYVNHRCRCAPCTAAATRATKRRRLITRDGARPILVNAAATRREVNALRAHGWTLQRIADAAGYPRHALKHVFDYPTLRRDKAVAIRAVHDRVMLATAPAAGPVRTRRAAGDMAAEYDHLRAFGYSDDYIATRLGVLPASLRRARERQAAA